MTNLSKNNKKNKYNQLYFNHLNTEISLYLQPNYLCIVFFVTDAQIYG